MPEAARERSASPPAGTALAPTCGMPPEGVLAGEIHSNVTRTVTVVNIKVTPKYGSCRAYPVEARGPSRCAEQTQSRYSPMAEEGQHATSAMLAFASVLMLRQSRRARHGYRNNDGRPNR